MKNTNRQFPENRKGFETDGTVEVVGVFETIQGEALHAGTPATFVRLAGCNLQCPWCDTDYTTNRYLATVSGIVETAKAFGHELVVITGGEPYRQHIKRLVRTLRRTGHIVQVETNGVYIDGSVRPDDVVCSPKTFKISPVSSQVVTAWKYVLDHRSVSVVDGLPTRSLGMIGSPARPTNKAPVFVQPCDEQDETFNRLNTEAAVDACMKWGYRLCPQIQKLVNVP